MADRPAVSADDSRLFRSFDDLQLGLSRRTANALHAHGIVDVGDLVKCSRGDIISLEGIGKIALQEIEECLRGIGLALGMNVLPAEGPSGRQAAPYEIDVGPIGVGAKIMISIGAPGADHLIFLLLGPAEARSLQHKLEGAIAEAIRRLECAAEQAASSAEPGGD